MEANQVVVDSAYPYICFKNHALYLQNQLWQIQDG